MSSKSRLKKRIAIQAHRMRKEKRELAKLAKEALHIVEKPPENTTEEIPEPPKAA